MYIDFQPTSKATISGRFGLLFRRDVDSAFERGLARLSVLYQDFYLEVAGMVVEVPELEAIGSQYRHCYFLRRAVATAHEVKQVIEQIWVSPEFREIAAAAVESQNTTYLRRWLPAVEFFKENGKLLKTIRDDVGGHFGDGAARKALEMVADEYTATIDALRDVDDRVLVLLPFATELAGMALLANVPGDTVKHKLDTLTDLLGRALECTVGVVHFLSDAGLWKRLETPRGPVVDD